MMTNTLSKEESSNLRNTLRRAVHDNNIRGLKVSAKWACEQLLGMSDIPDDEISSSSIFSLSEQVTNAEYDVILFANSLLSSGEYQRCANLIRSRNNPITSPIGLFISFYSLYMAGEKLKEQQIAERGEKPDKKSNNQSSETIEGDSSVGSKNPFLLDLIREMSPLYFEKRMDGFLLYIFGVAIRDVRRQGSGSRGLNDLPAARTVLLESLSVYACNWSCWLELAQTPPDSSSDHPTPHSGMGSSSSSSPRSPQSLAGWGASLSFRAHLAIEAQLGAPALELLGQLSTLFPQSLIVATQVALAHYCSRDYDKAQAYFERIRSVDPYRLDHIDTYSNILYVRERRADLSHLAHVATKIDKFSPEVCCVVGNYYSLKGQHEKAVLHFQRALKLNKRFLSAWTLMGHEFVELRNTAAAVQCYRQAVSVSPSDYRAWYGLGQTYEMLHLYQYALYYYCRAAAMRSSDARMWCAVGSCHHRMDRKPAAIVAFETALACDDSEGIAAKELARLYRETSQPAKAATCYLRHVTSQQEGVEVDADMAEALLFLSTHYRGMGRLAEAEALCSRLLCYSGPEGSDARSLMREIRTATAAEGSASGGRS